MSSGKPSSAAAYTTTTAARSGLLLIMILNVSCFRSISAQACGSRPDQDGQTGVQDTIMDVIWERTLSFVGWGLLSSFDNAADIKFILGFPYLFDWVALRHAAPPTTEYLTLPCSMMGATFTSFSELDQPILFESCLGPETAPMDMAFFPDKSQNVWPPCEETPVTEYTYTDLQNNTKIAIEDWPCHMTTLREKIDAWLAFDAGKGGVYGDMNARMLETADVAHVAASFKDDLGLASLGEGLAQARATVYATNFFHAGQSSVYYYHAHPDRFLTFNFEDEKVWHLIAPQYHNHFDSVWTGLAQLMLREREPAPVIEVLQKSGDVLYLPPWWIHEAILSNKRAKNWGMNLHWLEEYRLLNRLIAFCTWATDPTWFFGMYQ